MKKLIILIILNAGFLFKIQAQHTLTSASIPVDGDLFTSFLADTNNVRAGAGGPSKIWDFSSLQIGPKKFITKYVLPSTTTYGNDFSSSNLAAESNLPATNFIYMSTSANDIIIDGTADSLYQVSYSTDKQLYMTYPFSYDSTLTDAFMGPFTVAGNNFIRNGSWNIKGDGFGTLKLPSGTYSNVLRLHSVLGHNDGVVNTTTTNDSWYSSISKFPLLSITKTVRSGIINSVMHFVSVNSDVVNTYEINRNEVELSISPNPSTEKGICMFTLKNKSNIELNLFDMRGQKLANLIKGEYNPGIYAEHIDLQNIPSGIYILSFLTSKQETGRIKWVKQ